MHHTTAELQEQINYIRANHFIRSDFFDRRLNNRRRRRRRRGRFSKMKKLSEAQVENLFPKKTYHEWLNGGQERDHDHRDGMLQEEEDEDKKLAVVNTKTLSSDNSNGVTETDVTDIEMTEMNGSSSSNPNGVVEVTEDVLHFTSGSCAICLETIEDDDIVRGLVCGHVFHAECLDPWLTKRRACCPMCKRDYYYKDVPQPDNDSDAITNVTNDVDNDVNLESNGTTNNVTISAPDDDDNDSDSDLIDVEAFRNDPTLRAMLQELIPIEERVRMILSDETYSHLNLEAVGREIANRKYGNVFKVLFWKLMGIKKNDLYNYGVITAYHEFKLAEERRLTSLRPEAETSEDPETNVETTENQATEATQSAQTLPLSISGRSRSSSSIHTAQTHASRNEQDLGNLQISPETRRDVNDNRV